eukprot:9466766-Pyramimonas_sp.AAC.1
MRGHARERAAAGRGGKGLEITKARERDIAGMRVQLRQSELQQQAAVALRPGRDRGAAMNAVELLEGRRRAVAAERALA